MNEGEADDGQLDQKVENDQCLTKPPEMIRPPSEWRSQLPVETWENILWRFKDPNDVLLCSDVCRTWKLCLASKRTSAYFQLLIPKLMPYLGINDVLRCSAVSREWNSLIVSAVTSFRTHTLIWFNHYNKRFPCLRLHDNAEESQIQQFLAKKEDFPSPQMDNPLVYSHVVVSNGDGWNDQEYYALFSQNLLEFLKRFGKYIQQLELDSHVLFRVQMARLLALCLSNTPNLQNFKIFLNLAYTVGQGPEFDDVDTYLAATPLPTSRIKILHVTGDRHPTKIHQVLFSRYGNQLTDIENFFVLSIPSIIASGVTFQNLKVVRGTIPNLDYYEGETSRLDTFTQLIRTLNWTLAELEITLRGNYANFRLSFAYFFQALREHQPHIETFRVLNADRTFSLDYLEYMSMPNLKKLTLEMNGFPTVPFYQRATPALEFLTIETYEESIRPAAFLTAMWKAIPKCKTIEINQCRFYRPRM